MDGILIIDKPADWTSHDVVGKMRKILRTKRIGHTGTLDPFATGVLVILVGKATRLAQFLDKDKKGYTATVRLEFETDTGDLTGSPKSKVQSPKSISVDDIEEALAKFRGEILQTPPMYSAKKIDGKKLYELARKGIEVEREAVKITNYELRITNYEPPKCSDDFGLRTLDFGLEILCSAGTYIRTLAEDIGKTLGTGAHLSALRRTRAGKFDLAKAVTIEQLEKIASENELGKIFVSMNDALAHLPEIKLSADEILKVKNGVKLKFDAAKISDKEPVRLTDADENLLAVGFYNEREKVVQPKIVLV